ncbi:MAG: DUF6143 family protein [Herbinix sp.]|nr:DUF6143 family protein [Herbinix sp.]
MSETKFHNYKMNWQDNSLVMNNKSRDVIVYPDSVYHSSLGEYFLGQTETIHFGGRYYAWGGLINSDSSNAMMFLNAYTISNFSSQPITAEGWLSSKLPGIPRVSPNFAAGNQAILPPRQPKITIQNASNVNEKPYGGTYTFVRRVEPNQTLTKHDFQGMYIIPPGSSFVLFFLPFEKEQIEVKIAFGWWEEEIDNMHR